MVKEMLVEADLEAGRALLDMLRRHRVKITAAKWVQWGTLSEACDRQSPRAHHRQERALHAGPATP